MWDWNKLSPISGLSLPIEGLPKVQWGKAEWAAQNQGCGGQRWAVEHLGQPLAHSPCPPQSGVPAFTVLQPDEPLAVLRDRAQQISVSLMELPGVERTAWGGTLSSGPSVCSSVFVQLGCISVLGTGFGGFW